MKKSSEVCKLLGVTRKTLRGYDDIGLIHPTEKTDAGYWLYDDAAISKIKLILILTEGGYSRKEIKKLLESPTGLSDDVIDEIMVRLDQKKSRIESYIKSFSIFGEILKTPEPVLEILKDYNFNYQPDNQNFIQQLEYSVSVLDRKTDISTVEFLKEYMVVIMEIMAIGLLKNKEIGSVDVKACFVCLNKTVWDLIISDLTHEEVDEILNGKDKYEFAQFMAEKCFFIIQDLGVEDALDQLCGTGSYEYLEKVLNGLCISKEMVTMKII